MPSLLPKALQGRERSVISSSDSNIQASPIAARRSSTEERRRPAAKFDHGISPGPRDRIEEEDEEEDEGDGEGEGEGFYEDVGEDEAGELSPLLPIFSAAHLGIAHFTVKAIFVYAC